MQHGTRPTRATVADTQPRAEAAARREVRRQHAALATEAAYPGYLPGPGPDEATILGDLGDLLVVGR